jgi:CubicO group peptidase (beta-lactamase class C family)
MNSEAVKKAVKYIDSWLDFRYQPSGLPGYAVAISHNGEIVFNKAYGYANLETKEKLTPEHIFRIASHSKTFTATAIMQLAEQEKLRIDDQVVIYVPWLKQHTDKRWQKVTIRQLLSHNAGVIRDGLNSAYWLVDKPFPNAAQFKQELLKSGLIIENNTKMKYSNFGYTLLGLVIEAVSGKPYNTYVTQNIIKPLGLTNTFPELPAKQASKKFVTGYTRKEFNDKSLPIAPVDTKAMSSATGFCSTTADICKYVAAHFLDNDKLLDRESKKEMQRLHMLVPNSDYNEQYGLGFDIDFVNNHRLVGHGGGFPGQITKTLFDPSEKIAVTVLINSIGGEAQTINAGIYGVLDWFKNNYADKPKRKLDKFDGRFSTIWRTTDIVSHGDSIIAVTANSWMPFYNPDELEYIDRATLKIKKTNGFASEGELIKYTFTNSKPSRIIYAGTPMLPSDKWFTQKSKLKQISHLLQ